MTSLGLLTGFYRRLLRSRVAIFLGMAAVAYALASGRSTRAAVNSACATGNSDAYYASMPFGQQFHRTFVDALPGACQPCHTGNNGSSTRGAFGAAYEAQNQIDLGPDYVHAWTVALATVDSDGDGYTNGEELQDPQGAWHNGDPDPATGNIALVTDPGNSASLPNPPTISLLLGVTSGGTTQGTVTLQVQLSTTYGARKVVYDILDGGNQVVKSYTKQTSLTPYGGYTPLVSTFNQSWDTNDVPNGTYTVRATLTDATGLQARQSVKTVAAVTINNPARFVRYVATGGVNAPGCLSSAAPCGSVDYAVGLAQNNDEIRVAAGTYPVGSGASPLSIGTRVSLRGGYAPGSWAGPDPQANVTVLDGQGQRPVLSFTAGADGFSLSGFTITHGSGSLGGGVALAGASGSFFDDIFAANQSSGDGGALAVSAAGGATLDRVSFLGNTAAGRGGAVFSQAGLAMTNVVFGRNSAAQGGALAISGAATSTITYATISGAARPEEAVLLSGSPQTTALTNSLISGYATGVRLGSGVSLALQRVLVADGVTAPVTAQGGSVGGLPLGGLAGYVDAATDNYRLAFGAPAINAGAATPAITSDRDDLPRPVDGANDIGAYEFHGPAGALNFFDISLNVQQPASLATMEARLSVPSVSSVSVHYATADGTAHSAVDYTATSGTLTFAPGETSKLITIPVLNPSPAATLPRSFSITLSAATGAALGAFSAGSVTLLPPPDPPRVTLAATVADASRSGPRPGIITFERDVASDTPMTVSYTLGGNAQPGVDYAALPGTITFPPGALSTTLRIEPIGGSGTRLLTVTLQPGAGYLLGRTGATVRISGVLRWLVYTPLLAR